MQSTILTSLFAVLMGRISILALLFCGSAQAADFSPEALIEKSGTGVQLDFMPRSLKIGLGHALKNGALSLSTNQIRDIHAAFDHAYAPAKLRKMVAARIPARITPAQGKRILAFLDSPLGKRVVQLEARLAQPGIQAEIQENAARILADGGQNAARLALYSALDQATQSTRLAVETLIATALATHAAILGNTPDAAGKPTLEELRTELESQRFAITSAMSQAILSNMAYAYRDLSESELNRYLRFALTPDGKLYFQAIGDILAEVLVECAFDLGAFTAKQKQAPI